MPGRRCLLKIGRRVAQRECSQDGSAGARPVVIHKSAVESGGTSVLEAGGATRGYPVESSGTF